MRLIDADAIKEIVKGLLCPDGFKFDFVKAIDKAPAIENPCESCEAKAIEYSLGFQDGFLTGKDSGRKTGTWSRKIFPEEKWTRERFYCSVCNGWNTYGKSKYCPNCGAKMEEKQEGEK